jgi:hypothetical protein
MDSAPAEPWLCTSLILVPERPTKQELLLAWASLVSVTHSASFTGSSKLQSHSHFLLADPHVALPLKDKGTRCRYRMLIVAFCEVTKLWTRPK